MHEWGQALGVVLLAHSLAERVQHLSILIIRITSIVMERERESEREGGRYGEREREIEKRE